MIEYDVDALGASDGLDQRGFLARNWPYLVMLGFALLGTAYTSFARRESTLYWVALIPFFALMCMFTQWPRTRSLTTRSSVIWTETLHWGAVMLAVALLFDPSVKGLMAEEATALLVLLLLALGTLTASVRLGAWSLGVVGTVLAIGVPLIAWFENAALFIALASIVLAALVAMVVMHKLRSHKGAS